MWRGVCAREGRLGSARSRGGLTVNPSDTHGAQHKPGLSARHCASRTRYRCQAGYSRSLIRGVVVVEDNVEAR